MNEHDLRRDLASYEQEQAFLKHLTTLSTGSIIIIITFLEKTFSNPEWKILVAISIGLFLISILGSVITHFLSVLGVDSHAKRKMAKTELVIGVFSTFLAFSGFLGGIICLGVFAIKNI